MAIADDVTINYAAKTITVANNVYTVNALYSYLMDTFDELDQMDDDVPMSAQTPTVYTLLNGWTLAGSSTNFLSGGSVQDESGDNLWANVYTIGSIVSGSQIYIVQDGAVLSGWWGTDHIDVLVKVKDAGVDSSNITVMVRDYGDTYSHYKINLSAGGRNPVPLQTAPDNTTASSTVAAYGVTIGAFGTISRDLNNGNGAQNYDVSIDCGGLHLSAVYEFLKYATRRGSTTQIDSMDGDLYLAADDTYTEVPASPLGTFAGGTFFGARGVWITNYHADDAKNFQLIDSSGTTQSPPNVVGVSVSSVVAGDRVGVFVLTAAAGSIDTSQYTLDGAHSTGGGTVTVNEAVGTDTPAAGVIRVDGDRYAYSSWTGKVFTLSGTLSDDYLANADCYVPLIDQEASGVSVSNTLTYSSSIPVLVRVRKKGILPFEVETSVGSTGMSVAAIRTTDGVVS